MIKSRRQQFVLFLQLARKQQQIPFSQQKLKFWIKMSIYNPSQEQKTSFLLLTACPLQAQYIKYHQQQIHHSLTTTTMRKQQQHLLMVYIHLTNCFKTIYRVSEICDLYLFFLFIKQYHLLHVCLFYSGGSILMTSFMYLIS